MTQFERVVVMDNDCVVLRNIDHLATSVATPAAACHPRRSFALCSFNFGVHVLSPSRARAQALYRSYATRKEHNNGGEQEAWANFHKRVFELPIGYNAHRGLEMSATEWRSVHVMHLIVGYSVNRVPADLQARLDELQKEAGRLL